MAHALGYLKVGRDRRPASPFMRSDVHRRTLRQAQGRLRGTPVPTCVLFFFACIGLACAQPAPQAVRFTVFSAKPITDAAYIPRAKAEPVKLVFHPTARSPRYDFGGAMPLQFVDANSGAIIAQATIPPEIRDALLLFTPVAGTPKPGALRYQIAVLDDSAARQGPGGLAIVNLSGLALSGTVGNANVTLAAGLNPAIPLPRAAKVMLRTTFKNRSYQSYADTVELARNQRALLILFPPFYQGSLEVQSRLLIDQPPTPPR